MRFDKLGIGVLSALLLAAAPMVANAGDAVAAEEADQDRDQIRDQDQDQDRDQDQDQLREQEQQMDLLRTHLRKQLKMTDAECDAIQPELQRYFRLRGDQEPIRATIRVAWDANCKGECLRETVHAMNKAMVFGMQSVAAGEMVQATIRAEVQEMERVGAKWTHGEFGDQVRDQVRDRLRLWQREQERLLDQEMLREREREQQREQQRDMQRDQTGKPAGRGT